MLPRAFIDEYTRQLNLLSDSMKQALAHELEAVDWSDPSTARTRILAIMETFCGGATDAAATLAARFYELAREHDLGGTYDAYALSGRVPDATKEAVDSFLGSADATPETITSKLTARLGYEVKRAAGDTVFLNGKADKRHPRYARVPSGSDTCQFCLMLASRGFVYRNERTAGAGFLSHYHDNCDCRVVPGWTDTEVEGYDPSAIYRQWTESIDAEAAARAERNGTDPGTERAAIIKALQKASDRAKGKARLAKAQNQAGV